MRLTVSHKVPNVGRKRIPPLAVDDAGNRWIEERLRRSCFPRSIRRETGYFCRNGPSKVPTAKPPTCTPEPRLLLKVAPVAVTLVPAPVAFKPGAVLVCVPLLSKCEAPVMTMVGPPLAVSPAAAF